MTARCGMLLLALAAVAPAGTAISPPRAGYVRDSGGAVRPLLGIAGNFLLGDAVGADVKSAAFSGRFGMWKTDSSLAVTDDSGSAVAAFDAAAGPALFAFSAAGDPALVYQPASHLLLHWNGSAFDAVPFDFDSLNGEIVAISAPDASHGELIVRRDDGLSWVRLEIFSFAVEAEGALPGAAAPVLRLNNGDLVFTEDSGVWIRHAGADDAHIALTLPDGAVFEQSGAGWLQISSSAGQQPQYAVRLTAGREQAYQIPEAP